jgi:ankyrin repeat protein
MAEDAGLARQPNLLVALAQQNQGNAVRLLLDLGADPNAMASNGRGALHEAAWSGHEDMIRLLMEKGARLDVRSRAHGGTAVGYAHHAGRHELRDRLLEQSRDVFDLVTYGRTERLAALLGEDAGLVRRVKESGPELLATARDKGNAAAVELLIRYGA